MEVFIIFGIVLIVFALSADMRRNNQEEKEAEEKKFDDELYRILSGK